MAKITKLPHTSSGPECSGIESSGTRQSQPFVRPTKTPEQALRLLMNMCAKSEKATSDVRRALFRWGVDTAAHAGIIETLTAQKFIDDSRYAAAYVREKANLSRWGVHKIRAGLRAKQIAEETITEALMQIEKTDMGDKLETQLRRKMKTIKAKNSYDLRGKLLRYGAGLGFDFSDVNDLVDRLVQGSDDDEF